jgi:hypothetical protein
MKEIKDYIQFAIDNWLSRWKIFKIEDHYVIFRRFDIDLWKRYNIIDFITWKEFIEAIARWTLDIEKDKKDWDESYVRLNFKNTTNAEKVWREQCIDQITFDQAIAIRDWKLKEFIKNLGIN